MAQYSREHLHRIDSFGERLADSIATQMGSWRFIIIQSAVVMTWMIINGVGVALHWDPYPFILLNLLFSTQAAYAAPIIMMSQNRSAAKDHKRDDLEAKEVAEMFKINKDQMKILKQQMEILQMLHAQEDKKGSRSA